MVPAAARVQIHSKPMPGRLPPVRCRKITAFCPYFTPSSNHAGAWQVGDQVGVYQRTEPALDLAGRVGRHVVQQVCVRGECFCPIVNGSSNRVSISAVVKIATVRISGTSPRSVWTRRAYRIAERGPFPRELKGRHSWGCIVSCPGLREPCAVQPGQAHPGGQPSTGQAPPRTPRSESFCPSGARTKSPARTRPAERPPGSKARPAASRPGQTPGPARRRAGCRHAPARSLCPGG